VNKRMVRSNLTGHTTQGGLLEPPFLRFKRLLQRAGKIP